MDEIFAFEKLKLGEFHTDLNILVSEIESTRKEGCETTLPFLDILIMKQADGNIETTIH